MILSDEELFAAVVEPNCTPLTIPLTLAAIWLPVIEKHEAVVNEPLATLVTHKLVPPFRK